MILTDLSESLAYVPVDEDVADVACSIPNKCDNYPGLPHYFLGIHFAEGFREVEGVK